MAALKPNSRLVLDYVKSVDGVSEVTAMDIAAETGLTKKQVDGIITSAFQKRKLMERIPAEFELEDGTHKAVKFIRLTDKGRAFDPDAEVESK